MGEGAGSETAAMVTISNTIVKAGAAGLNIANFSGTFAISNTSLKATGALGGNIYNSNGAINSLGYNLSSDAAGGDGTTVPGGFLDKPGDIRNTEPSLGLLKDNGGPTFTHELLAGSPAIDAGDPNFTPPPDFDQRGTGYPRVVNGRIDIGAFEVQTTSACPQPKGYWKSNPALWPVTSLTLGSQTYLKTQLLTILKMAVGTGPKRCSASPQSTDRLGSGWRRLLMAPTQRRSIARSPTPIACFPP